MADTDTPQPAPPTAAPRNPLGLVGFILSMLGLFTCGLLSPIAMLVSGWALRRKPRVLAVAGVIVGALGSLALIVLLALGAGGTIITLLLGDSIKTAQSATRAQDVIHAWQDEHGRFPDDKAGQAMIVTHGDAWGTPLRYEKLDNPPGFLIRSAGPDGRYDTTDDLTYDSRALRSANHDTPPSPSPSP